MPLTEELAFFDSYVALTRLRYPRSIQIQLDGFSRAATAGVSIPPASLQLLLENAIKHNQFDEAVARFSEIALGSPDYKFENGERAAEIATGARSRSAGVALAGQCAAYGGARSGGTAICSPKNLSVISPAPAVEWGRTLMTPPTRSSM